MRRLSILLARLGGPFLWAGRRAPDLFRLLAWLGSPGALGSARRALALGRLRAAFREALRVSIPMDPLILCLFFGPLLAAGLLSAGLALFDPQASRLVLTPPLSEAAIRAAPSAFGLAALRSDGSATLVSLFEHRLASPNPALREASLKARRRGLSLAAIPEDAIQEPLDALAAAGPGLEGPKEKILLYYRFEPQEEGLARFFPFEGSEPASALLALESGKRARLSLPRAAALFFNPWSDRFLSASAASDTVDPQGLSPAELAAARAGAVDAMRLLPDSILHIFFKICFIPGALLAVLLFTLALSRARACSFILIAPITPAELSALELQALSAGALARPSTLKASRESRL